LRKQEAVGGNAQAGVVTDRRFWYPARLPQEIVAMLPLVESKRPQIDELCRLFHVKRLELFGSAARGGFDPDSSDLDFLVEFAAVAPGDYADAYFSLKEALETLFGRAVDLVTAPSVVNPYLRDSIEATRQPLYAA